MIASGKWLPIRTATFLAGFLLGLGLTSSAFAGEYAQDGRQSDNSSVDGASAHIKGHSFYAASGDCVIYGLLVWDSDAPRHVETGLLRCDGTTLDGTCPGGEMFAERYNGSSYFCNPGGDFNNGTNYYTYIQRNNGGVSTTMTGYIGGTSISQSGFVLSNDVYTLAWGETTSGGNATCPTGDAHGQFTLWQKWIAGSGWSTVSNADVYHYAVGVAGPCWTVGVQSDGGGFHVW